MRSMAVILSLLLSCIAAAQNLPAGMEDMLEQLLENESGTAADELQQWYETLLLHPLDINTASRAQLENLRILTLFQIESLLEYREEYGGIMSLAELSMVDGFSREFVQTIAPVVSLSGEATAAKGSFSQLRSKLKWKSTQEGLYRYARYLGGAGRFSYGLTLESDAQESLMPDFMAAHLQYDTGRFKLLLGDFSAGYGQGLAMDKSFSISALGSPSAIIKRRNDFRGYTASGENDAFRGLAVSAPAGGRGRVQAFFSAAALDATVTDSAYTSLPATGYHRTEYQKSQKNALREYVGCVNYSFETSRLQLSLTAAAYGYDKRNGRRVQDYNRYQMYDGMYGNIALSALYSAGHSRFYGESALDAKGRPAALAGLVWSPGYNFEGALQFRFYPKDYIAAHGGAYSSLSTVSNQWGVLVNLLARPFGDFTVTAMADAAYHPHVRYRVDGPSFVAKVKVRCEYTQELWSVYVQDNYSFRDYEGTHKHALKLAAACSPSERFTISGRADCVVLFTGAGAGPQRGYRLQRGLSASLSAGWQAAGFLKFWGVVSCFDAPSYDTRIYVYEKDLPQNFSVVSRSGRGVSAGLLVTAAPAAGAKVSLKAAFTRCDVPDNAYALEIRGQLDWNFPLRYF